MSTPAIVLIGPMGAGKSSVGKRVAKALGVPFTDTDTVVVSAHGPIEQIFVEHGEPHFRALERAAVVSGLQTGGVVSLGGGAVLDPATQTDLAGHHVVLLTVQPRTVAARVRGSKRPLLAGDDAIARWTEIYEARRPTYERLADVTFDTSAGPIQSVIDAVAALARTHGWTAHDDEAPVTRPAHHEGEPTT